MCLEETGSGRGMRVRGVKRWDEEVEEVKQDQELQ